LNPTGKTTLIKYVLSAYPIYQCVAMLTPKGIMEHIAKNIRIFLWGGKVNTHTHTQKSFY
jgi:hypothetical protein